MKSFVLLIICPFLIILISCGGGGLMDEDVGDTTETSDEFYSMDSDGGSKGGQGGEGQAGIVTAGEWNDLDNWTFWLDLINSNYQEKPEYWGFNTENRLRVQIQDTNQSPLGNISVDIKNGQDIAWSARTDIFGIADLWIDLFDMQGNQIDTSQYSIWADGQLVQEGIRLFEKGNNVITMDQSPANSSRIELSFVVDATGSMSDEIDFLKNDLLSVINTVTTNQSGLNIATSAVFYRDKGDEYLTRISQFSEVGQTLDFIKAQNANGGGDYPEAVDEGLRVGLDELDWSDEARTKLIFLLLDAPPHHNQEIIEKIKTSVMRAASKGIKVIPISASGVDKNTEFLMRFLSISTNGTYVFITNHSGVGNDHIEASVGEYEVELLNELLVRLIEKYSTLQ